MLMGGVQSSACTHPLKKKDREVTSTCLGMGGDVCFPTAMSPQTPLHLLITSTIVPFAFRRNGALFCVDVKTCFRMTAEEQLKKEERTFGRNGNQLHVTKHTIY